MSRPFRWYHPYPEGFIGPVQPGERSYICGRIVFWVDHPADGELYASWE